ncbi:MAG: UDP-N-acetylmuramoyl-L-alanyl-D-glutamate--2,6-diaminopimelate ligase [Odoribacteraceae bacterium]|jgi:UDP-N-acetylmuramoyl-L-alanyl-D-glutamate--2,6-diaminopimelate ligase|nr:UDP-N-acetylmuramoyl-L-alanyl-D-glutamate--2,6-diaminopimelate ligase [Odoribacteraceae bacterium]
MKLSELLKGVPVELLQGDDRVEIAGVHFDSRAVREGFLFVAQRGVHADGHAFINRAIEAGAVAVLLEVFPENLTAGVTYVRCADSSAALGTVAGNLHGNPSRQMKLVGVTGTNGKTTTATLLYDLARLLGHPAGLLSTVCNYIGDVRVDSTHTTPDALEINELMRRMVDAGCRYCFMEVSSHAVDQKRVNGLSFDGAIFSNITHDHLDYHKTFKAYIEAKKAFFDHLPAEAFALTNADDKNGLVMLQNTAARKYTYACKRMADFTAKTIERHLHSTLLSLNGREVWVKFVGDFNAYNLLAVYSAASLLGFPTDDVLLALSRLCPVSGRFETLLSDDGVMAIVDYAHTPDALDNVLSTIEGLKSEGSRVITVVGAGGNRDRTKRPEMAASACRFSDRVILTSDNPRGEEPAAIIEEMYAGVPPEARERVLMITDRKEAIRAALMLARRGDLVLVAGKGHENYQEIKGVKHPFDDKEVIKAIFYKS